MKYIGSIRARVLRRVPRPLYVWAGDQTIKLAKAVGNAYGMSWDRFHLPYFEHEFDYLRGPEHWYWTERGVFGAKLISAGDKVLDIGCGDGTYSGLFYSLEAAQVDALDRDPTALAIAQTKHAKSNIQYFECDILESPFPNQHYDVAFMFAVIEHLSVEGGHRLLQKIASVLTDSPRAAFLGSTPLAKTFSFSNYEHDNEFFSLDYLQQFVSVHFEEVNAWVSNWPGGRLECYFECHKPRILSLQALSEAITFSQNWSSEYRRLLAEKSA